MHGWKKNGERSYGQVGFQKHHSTIDHLVTLWVLMEESHLRGKGLYCCFIDFKKAFDMVPCEYLWSRMEELKVWREDMLAISQIYENVICCVCMKGKLWTFSCCWFRVRVDDNDWDGVCDELGGVMARLISIAGWGVVPRMAPSRSQGGSTWGRERERKRWQEIEIRDNLFPFFIHSP